MANPTGIKTKTGRTADESIVLFKGDVIGTIKRFETAKPIRASQRVSWAIYSHDEYNSIGWCSNTRSSALRRLRSHFIRASERAGGYRKPGDFSTSAKLYISRVKARLEGESK